MGEREDLLQMLHSGGGGESRHLKGIHAEVRRLLNVAGVPCYFGENGIHTNDGIARDLLDCVKDIIADRDAALADSARLREIAEKALGLCWECEGKGTVAACDTTNWVIRDIPCPRCADVCKELKETK